jgi:membrane associated rhomboid family serine protease
MYGNRNYSGFNKQGSLLNSVIGRIVIANAVMFILTWMPIGRPVMAYLALTPKLVLTRGYAWQMVTYMFLHADFWHITLNMFVIWMFGRTLEQIWGSTRFLKFYLACGLGGAVFSFLFAYNTAVIGASAAAYGILLAYAIMFPNQRLLLWFVIPVKARTLAIGLAVLSVVLGIRGGGNIAHFAHLGGMAAALIMMRGEYQFRRFRNFISSRLSKLPVKISFDGDGQDGDRKSPPAAGQQSDMDKIDSILDSISDKGYENLSETERRILERYSEQEREQGDDDDSETLH